MSELQAYYDNFASQSQRWADEDPEDCGCRGSGFFCSDVDTIHACPYHGDGARHPDDMSDDDGEISFRLTSPNKAHRVAFHVRYNRVEIDESRYSDEDGGWNQADFTNTFRPQARAVWSDLLSQGYTRGA